MGLTCLIKLVRFLYLIIIYFAVVNPVLLLVVYMPLTDTHGRRSKVKERQVHQNLEWRTLNSMSPPESLHLICAFMHMMCDKMPQFSQV